MTVMKNFYQSAPWQQMYRELGVDLITGEGEGWRYFGQVLSDRFGTFVYVPGGPVARDRATLEAAIEDVKREAKRVGAYRAIIEPLDPFTADDLSELAERRIEGYNHSRTQVVDLDRPWDEVMADMDKNRRKQFRSAERKGLEFAESTDPADFDLAVKWLRVTGEKKDFEVRGDAYFEAFRSAMVGSGAARVFVGKHEGITRMVRLIVDYEDTRYAVYTGRDPESGTMTVMSPFNVYLMLDAQQRGLTTFDMFGIAETDDPDDERAGFTSFKRSFGGETVEFAGTWEVPVSALKYRAWRAASAVVSAARR